MRYRLTPKDLVNVIEAYTVSLEPMTAIAARYNVTRQCIHRALKRSNIDTSGRKIAVSCSACGKVIKRHKSEIRNKRHLFCSIDCYYAFLGAHQTRTYQQSLEGQQRARDVVSGYFDLQPLHVVHHENGNNWHNEPDNLKVFATQGDHIRYHLWAASDSVDILPLWDGSLEI